MKKWVHAGFSPFYSPSHSKIAPLYQNLCIYFVFVLLLVLLLLFLAVETRGVLPASGGVRLPLDAGGSAVEGFQPQKAPGQEWGAHQKQSPHGFLFLQFMPTQRTPDALMCQLAMAYQPQAIQI